MRSISSRFGQRIRTAPPAQRPASALSTACSPHRDGSVCAPAPGRSPVETPAPEVAVLGDVAEEFLRQEPLARREVQHLELVRRWSEGPWLRPGPARRTRASLKSRAARRLGSVVEQDVLPSRARRRPRLSFSFSAFLSSATRDLGLFLGLHHLEERVAEQLLLQVLLKVEQRHVEQVHRLVQARIDPQVLAQRRVLMQAGLHAAGACSRARRRAVRVGPK